MDYLRLVLSVATLAPTIVGDVKRFVEAFKHDDGAMAVLRTVLDAIEAGVNDIRAILPDDPSKLEK